MPNRRAFLALAAAGALAACSSGEEQDARVSGTEKITYGSDPSQFGELTRPKGESAGTVVLVHGGFWQAQYDLSLGRPLAADLVKHGYTTWNLEYRRIGDGGGYPQTLADVAAGVDRLARLDVDTDSVVIVGHSAGGQLAVWAAGRGGKSAAEGPGANPTVRPRGVVSQAGVLDLATAARQGVGGGAPQQLAGGEPDAVADHYRVADPIMRLPLEVPVLCLHSMSDANVPYAQSTAYVAAATRAGGQAALSTTEGDHFTLIDPTSEAWTTAREAIPDLARGRLPG